MIVRANYGTATRSLAEVVRALGDVPLERIRATPAPGTATEEDLQNAGKPTCELIDGVLVEKAVGDRESLLAVYIGHKISNYVEPDDLGVILGEAGHFTLEGGQIRAPDVSFTPWSAFPNDELPEEAYWSVAPALFVEVLSPKNTKAEIDRKLREFFAAGSQLAWVIDPKPQTAKVYTSAKRFKAIDAAGTLDGGKVLPGFKLPLADLFAATRRRKKKSR
jgi:Uma2 family endonuclease